MLTGRVLAAENVRSSDTPTIRTLLQPISDLDLPVLGAISDAQESILQAVAALWPAIPHQVCQFHYLREASRPIYEVDRALRKTIRKVIQQPVRDVRTQLVRQIAKLEMDGGEHAATAAQLQLLSDYALAVQTAVNLDGQQPFRYASLAVDDALSEIAVSLARLQKGAP